MQHFSCYLESMKPMHVNRMSISVSITRLGRVLLCFICYMQLAASSSFASQAVRGFNEADATLNKVYQTVLGSIVDPRQRALLVAAQEAWLKYRDDNVAFMAEFDAGSKGGLFLKTDLTEARTVFLRKLLTKPE